MAPDWPLWRLINLKGAWMTKMASIRLTWLKKSSSGGRCSVPRRQRKVKKSSVLGRSPFANTVGPVHTTILYLYIHNIILVHTTILYLYIQQYYICTYNNIIFVHTTILYLYITISDQISLYLSNLIIFIEERFSIECTGI